MHGGLLRGWRGRREDPFPGLLAGSIALFLVLFSTRVPVYDGERLFLLDESAYLRLADPRVPTPLIVHRDRAG